MFVDTFLLNRMKLYSAKWMFSIVVFGLKGATDGEGAMAARGGRLPETFSAAFIFNYPSFFILFHVSELFKKYDKAFWVESFRQISEPVHFEKSHGSAVIIGPFRNAGVIYNSTTWERPKTVITL